MTTFERNTLGIFSPIVSTVGFREALAACSGRRVAFMSRLNDLVCAYLFVTDGRPGGANVDVDVWIAPTDFPGDSIEKLGVGIKIGIASSYEIDDAFTEA